MTAPTEGGTRIGADAVVGESRGAAWTRQPEDLLEQVAWFNRLRVVASVAMHRLMVEQPDGTNLEMLVGLFLKGAGR